MKSIYMQLTIIFAQQKPCALSKETENLIMGYIINLECIVDKNIYLSNLIGN